jgi:hypothetical protein
MSNKVRQAVELLFKSVEENSAKINQKLCDVGVKPTQNQALVFSAAKYFEALSKLAEE